MNLLENAAASSGVRSSALLSQWDHLNPLEKAEISRSKHFGAEMKDFTEL